MIDCGNLVRALLVLLLVSLPGATRAQTEATLILVDASGTALDAVRPALQAALGSVGPDSAIGLRVFSRGTRLVVLPQPAGREAIRARLDTLRGDPERNLAKGLQGALTDFGLYRARPSLVLITTGSGRDPAADLAAAQQLVRQIPMLKVHLVGVDLDAAGRAALKPLAEEFRTPLTEATRDALKDALVRLAPFAWSDPGPPRAAPVAVARTEPTPATAPPPPEPTSSALPELPEPTALPPLVGGPGAPASAPAPAPIPADAGPSAAPFGAPPALPAGAPATPAAAPPAASPILVLAILALFGLACLQLPGEAPRAMLYLALAGVLSASLAAVLRTIAAASPTAVLMREVACFVVAGGALGFLHGTAVSLGGGGLRLAWGFGWLSGALGAFGGCAGLFSPAVLAAFGKGAGTPLAGTAGHAVCWGILGTFVGAGPGLVAHSTGGFLWGAVAGLVGGCAGGGAYGLAAARLDDALARALGLAVLGALLGVLGRVPRPAAAAPASAPSFPPGALARLTPLSTGAGIYLMSEENVLGTRADSLVPGAGTDPVHALIKRVKGEWYIFDKSTTGTRVNGARITQRTPLVHGCTIGVGAVELRFELPIG